MITRQSNKQLERDYSKIPNEYYRLFLQNGITREEFLLLNFFYHQHPNFNCTPKCIARAFQNCQTAGALKQYKKVSSILKNLEELNLIKRTYKNSKKELDIELIPVALSTNEKFIYDNAIKYNGSIQELICSFIYSPISPEITKTIEKYSLSDSDKKHLQEFLAISDSKNTRNLYCNNIKLLLDDFFEYLLCKARKGKL